MFEQIAPVEYDKCGRMKYNPDLHFNQGKSWNDDDLDYLINWYTIIGLEEMSLALGRTEGTIASKVNQFRNQGRMPREPQQRIIRELKPKSNPGRPKKATKNPDQSVQSSIVKNSPSLYHMNGGMQIAN
ncbi:hypothetical protein [Clostridium sp.]|uniref:hypothetical protein n=1 Tax=Clostridium sp. TaxID=1506 RepID=UPI00284250FC|nr:hypothetical protein [Clostridium sp.]MDR3593811.1 hypothetical protein [Clostridium sp.]